MKNVKRILMILPLLFIGLISCNKDNDIQDNNKQMVTQSFKLTTIIEDRMNLKSSFDPATFVYEFSDEIFELKFQNETDVYSINCSVQELIAGTVSIRMAEGTYNVTYTPIHSPMVDRLLDVSINEVINVTGTPITLQGNIEDALVVVDISTYISNYTGQELSLDEVTAYTKDYVDRFGFAITQNGYHYFYINQDCNLQFAHINGTFDIKQVELPHLEMGKVYWIVSGVSGGVILDITDLEVEKIII